MATREWRWDISDGVSLMSPVCTECGRNTEEVLGIDVMVTDGERALCMDCAMMVLNAREDRIDDMKAAAMGSLERETASEKEATCKGN